ncbi:cytochrome c domain-containing protein [Ditylenchus destructor]|nr:cytochrome c domain-containing protein [Ditylenchus destructor]
MRRQLQISLALMLAGSAFVVSAQSNASSQTGAGTSAGGNPGKSWHRVARCPGARAGQGGHVHRLPWHSWLSGDLPGSAQGPDDRGPERQVLAAALAAYAKGDRKHPTMRGIAMPLKDEDIAQISEYYATQAKVEPVPATVEPPAEVRKLLDKGACASCHGANFSKPIDGTYPKIAGQHADYLYVALKSYQTEGKHYVGRTNAVMAGQVKQFTHAELKTLSQYLASLPSELRTVPQSRFR